MTTSTANVGPTGRVRVHVRLTGDVVHAATCSSVVAA